MLRVFRPLYNSKKLALHFFRMEQQKNTSLQSLSAVQKKKVILKMFKELNAKDMEALRVKAAVWEAKKMGASDVNNSYRKRNELTPYELFFREQLSNPSIASISSPVVREKKLFAIYNSLPDVTKEALERRARELSEGSGVVSHTKVPRKRPLGNKLKPNKKKKRKSKLSSRSLTKTTAKRKTKKSVVRKESSAGSVVSPFAVFVKEQMPHVKHLPTKERMKEIAMRWKTLKTTSAVAAPVPTETVAADAPPPS